MRTLFFIFISFFGVTTAMAQNDFDISIDNENGSKVFKGEFNFEALESEPSFQWFTENEKKFNPDSGTLNQIKPVIAQYNFVVIMGTWCSDSHVLIPQLHKVLEYVHFPVQQFQLFGTDRAKETKYMEHKIYKLDRVPTIVIRRGPTEVGRIVETVKESLEKDLAYIILRDQETKPQD